MDEKAPLIPLDAETKAHERPREHKAELRLWLRLLTCTNMIEAEIRRRLRQRFDVTLPRFDLMAQLEKAPDGLTLSEVSKRMMVSSGNVTGLVERLVNDGLIERRTAPNDRRATYVRLTARGHESFAEMAGEHGDWIGEVFEGLSDGQIDELMALLETLKASVRQGAEREQTP
ncbi:MarR family winged helix-turn-helix transcriptional regulator [Kaustia mangrovi]|uniref:MarR family winged helix-turn-helix transcriptional regulator n=1 Tax=Kaustia mangrovi TaxID=2593653 RepID=UPI001FE7D8C8|nr:MarR family transcriptional regulator [Kaustia mangrovi]